MIMKGNTTKGMYVLAEKKTTGIFFTAILAMIAATNFTAMMNTTAVTILLPVFMREFQTDIITTQWVVTAYILATCTVAPVVGYLSDRISLKRTFLLAVSGFAISTLLLGLVNHIYPFIALRVLQGIFGGMLMPCNPIHDLPPVSTAKTGARPLASGPPPTCWHPHWRPA